MSGSVAYAFQFLCSYISDFHYSFCMQLIYLSWEFPKLMISDVILLRLLKHLKKPPYKLMNDGLCGSAILFTHAQFIRDFISTYYSSSQTSLPLVTTIYFTFFLPSINSHLFIYLSYEVLNSCCGFVIIWATMFLTLVAVSGSYLFRKLSVLVIHVS